MTEQSQLQVHIQNQNHCKQGLERTFTHRCSQQHRSQTPRGRSGPNAHGLASGQTQRGVHTSEILALKGEETLSHVTAWANLEDIMLRERSQAQNATYGMIPHI